MDVIRSLGRGWRAALAVALSAAATIALALAGYREVGPASVVLTFVPVALAAIIWGSAPGALVGLAIAALDALALTQTGIRSDPIGLGGLVVGSLGLASIGVITGRMRELADASRAQAETLRRELEQRRHYTDVLAHELRGPIVSIRAAARSPDPDPRIRELIAEEAARALELIDSLNDASSIEAGRMRSVLGPTDLVAAVRAVADSSSELAGRIRLQLPAAPVTVNGDGERLRQVLRNLVSNAAKYAPGASAIELNVGISADRRCGVVQVRDYGPGIPPAERPRLFERFTRLSTADGTTGSGLGLYISRGIVRDHKGELEVEWPSGGGTLFAFEIPLAAPPADRRARPR